VEGKLKGKIVLVDAARELIPQTVAPSKRFSDADLLTEGLAPDHPLEAHRAPTRVSRRCWFPEDQETSRSFRSSVPAFASS